MTVSNYFKNIKANVCAAGSYVKNIPSRVKQGTIAGAAKIVEHGFSRPMLPQIVQLQATATQMLSRGQAKALTTLDNSVVDITNCAKSVQKLLKTVDNVVNTGAELVGFVAGLYVFNLPGKVRHISRFACTAQKVAGLSIAAISGLRWLNRAAKPFLQEHVLDNLLPSRWQ